MGEVPEIDQRFLAALESAVIALEIGAIPLIIFADANPRRFIAQVSAALGATVVYVSQKDFGDQFRASMKRGEDTLFVMIDQQLKGKTLQLVNAYLAARDSMGAENTQLQKLSMSVPVDGHRMALFIEKPVFATHDMDVQEHLAEFCNVIGVS